MASPSRALRSIIDPCSGSSHQDKLDAMLLLATFDGDLAQVKNLLSLGANPESRHPGPGLPELDGRALHIAAREDYPAIVEALLVCCDPNALDANKSTALMVAAFHHNDQVVSLLAPKTDHSLCGDDSLTAFQCAILQGNCSTFDILLPYESENPARSSAGHTALMSAACEGNLEFAERLLAINDPLAHSLRGSTALMEAAMRGDVEMVELLAPHSNFDAVNLDGETAEMVARSHGESSLGRFIAALKLSRDERMALSSLTPRQAPSKKSRL